MLEIIRDIVLDALFDTVKLLPFLFVTYLIMEYIEHKMSEKTKNIVKKSKKFGPLFGGFAGVVPQCGFSASATNLYAGRVISLGTLIAVYLSTSDEMLPIFLSESVPIGTILGILGIKLLIGIIVGFIIDIIFRFIKKEKLEDEQIHDLCEHEHCDCEHNNLFLSAFKHTVNITIYIFLISLVISCIVEFVGEKNIEVFMKNNTILGPIISSLIGLIPNCAASVIITNLYIQNIINGASLISGLLTGAGVGLIVLFKMNKNLKENMMIVGILYVVGVVTGILMLL